MITTDVELDVVRRQLARAEAALDDLRREVRPTNDRLYRDLAGTHVDAILTLRADIDTYLGVAARPPSAALAVSLEGGTVALGRTSAGLATRAVDTFRRGLQSLVEALEKGKTADTATRHDRWIERLCDLPLVGVAGPGVQLLLGRPAGGTLFTDDDRRTLDAAIDALFDGLEWADPTHAAAPDGFLSRPPNTRQVVLSVVLRLLPPRFGPVERVLFAHRPGLGRPPRLATLTRKTRAAVRAGLAALTAGRDYVEAEGVIRAVDLNDQTFVLSNRPGNQPDLPCTYHERTEDAVKALLDCRVVVSGNLDTSRARKVTLEADAIEPLAADDAPPVGEPRP